MPRHPEPWFRDGRGWYVQLDGHQVFLGEHPPGHPKPKRDEQGRWHPPHEVRDEFHRRMAARGTPPAPPLADPETASVVGVLDAFLDWLDGRVREGSKARRSYDWYRDYLQDFARFQTPAYRVRDLTVDRLSPVHIYQWADSHPGWGTGKRGAMTAVQRAFNWAANAGLLKSAGGVSPLRSLEKPPQGRREKLVSEAEYLEVLSLVRDQSFHELLELSWETGCRPHELFSVEAAHADLATGRWVFPVRLSKGKKVQRVVYLSDRALDISRRLVSARPSGPLLVNTGGRPWCASSVKCRFQKLCRAVGRNRIKAQGLVPAKIPRLTADRRQDPVARAAHEARVAARRKRVNDLARESGVRLNLYAFRHSLITESLVNGLDAVTVSVLAGHRDTAMISRHYAHLAQRHGHMRAAANRARGDASRASGA